MGSLGIDIGGSSVKVSIRDKSGRWFDGQSNRYIEPTRESLSHAIREGIECAIGQNQLDERSWDSIGMCLPGRVSGDGTSIELSLNLPCLNGWKFDEMLEGAIGRGSAQVCVYGDVRAAGYDWVLNHQIEMAEQQLDVRKQRAAIIAIGTGVGLQVFDGVEPIGIGDRGIGHLGMVDIGRNGDQDVVARDGALNTLESYLGAHMIQSRFPDVQWDQIPGLIEGLGFDDPIMIALVRMIRMVHAIYSPDQIVLMGGVGLALRARSDEIDRVVRDRLTSLAVDGWELRFGDSLFHASRGAAERASMELG